MAGWLFCCWTPLWIVLFLLSNVSADPSSSSKYTLHQTRANFEDAMQRCSPGVLTTIATQQEVDDILKLIIDSVPLQENFTFWVGLKKAKNQCVVLSQPLKGFRWTENSSEESQVSRWAQQPAETCTGVLCAALMGKFDGSTVSWGLIPVTCKSSYHFICKLKNRPTDVCQHPSIPETRFLTLDSDNSSLVQVECWSTVRLNLLCSGRPAMWRTLDGLPVNFSTACLKCSNGFQKDAFGSCVDVDECANPDGSPCRRSCVNTEGSYRCVCSDADGEQHDEDSPPCQDQVTVEDSGALSGILIPVLIAVAALVVLVVVVAVTVKCCLMRRSKKRAIKAAEKMAMKSKQEKDSFQTANEKTAT
uniref:Complement component C1q receptor-like n=1 Tax=Acanthochromis polyacanthus TaxID=80966 RepID=A0A3Q1EN40_9TELE